MNALILIGMKRTPSGLVPENLYTGLDGVALQKAADEAAATKEYAMIGRVTNPHCAPMPIDPTPTVGSKPTFTRPKVAEAPKVEEQLVSPLEEAAAKQRAERLKPSTEPSIKSNEKPNS